MPGHARAAIRSMERRYRNYIAQGDKAKATEFLLSDPKDRSMYMSGQFFTDNAINPCMESTYLFVEHIIVELQKMHKVSWLPVKYISFLINQLSINSAQVRHIVSLGKII